MHLHTPVTSLPPLPRTIGTTKLHRYALSLVFVEARVDFLCGTDSFIFLRLVIDTLPGSCSSIVLAEILHALEKFNVFPWRQAWSCNEIHLARRQSVATAYSLDLALEFHDGVLPTPRQLSILDPSFNCGFRGVSRPTLGSVASVE